MTDTTVGTSGLTIEAYNAAADAHVATGGTLADFDASHGYTRIADAVVKPLATTPPQGDGDRGGLSPERYAQEKAEFIRLGGSEALWQAQMVEGASDAAPAASEAQRTHDDMIAAGMTPEAVAEAFKAAGVQLPGQAADTRSDEAREHDKHHPGVRPSDYNPGLVPPAPGVDLNAHAHGLGELRGMLAAAQVDADVGSSMIAEMVDTGRSLAAASPPAQQLWLREQASLLDQISRGNAEAWTADANAVLAKADQSVVEAFRRSGVLSSASVVASLHHHAARIRARAEA